MTREFLQNFKVGEQALPKEVVDAILDENSRDIGETKKGFADYDTLKSQLSEAQKTIKGFQDMDVDGIKQSAREWEDKYNQAIKDHEAEKAENEFQASLGDAITALKGKNVKAISALLDLEALRKSQNREADIKAALEGVQKENEYLFGEEQTPPPYAHGGGHQTFGGSNDGVEAAFAKLNPGLKLN